MFHLRRKVTRKKMEVLLSWAMRLRYGECGELARASAMIRGIKKTLSVAWLITVSREARRSRSFPE